jgi:hypothetical protein
MHLLASNQQVSYNDTDKMERDWTYSNGRMFVVKLNFAHSQKTW